MKEEKTTPMVIALGELLIDFSRVNSDKWGYPTMQGHPGGAPANFLAALAKHGMKTAFLGKVGKDDFGKLLKETLKQAGINTDGLLLDETVFTTLAFVTLNHEGERSFSFARKPGADTCLKPEEINYRLLADSDIFHFGTLSLTDEPSASATREAVAFAKTRGTWISFDPNLRLPLWKQEEHAKREMEWGLHQADFVKLSEEEARFLWNLEAEEATEKLMMDYPARLGFVTCGSGGAYYIGSGGKGRVSVPEGIHAVDTTGAGDIFFGSAMAAFLAYGKSPEKLTGEELRKITEHACAVAALSTTRAGGISSVPEPAEANRLLSEQSRAN